MWWAQWAQGHKYFFCSKNCGGHSGHKGTNYYFLSSKNWGGLSGHQGTNYFQVLLFFQGLHKCGGHSGHKGKNYFFKVLRTVVGSVATRAQILKCYTTVVGSVGTWATSIGQFLIK